MLCKKKDIMYIIKTQFMDFGMGVEQVPLLLIVDMMMLINIVLIDLS
jgi:hypothetical protein